VFASPDESGSRPAIWVNLSHPKNGGHVSRYASMPRTPLSGGGTSNITMYSAWARWQRALFERAGFIKAADTDWVSGGVPRVLMRLGPS
jgi:hypothetical protein